MDSGSTIWIVSASGALLVALLLLLRERAARGDAGEDGSRLVRVPIRVDDEVARSRRGR